MENHKHRIPITAAQIIQFTGHVTCIDVMCSTIHFGKLGWGWGRVQMWGLEGLKRYSPKELFEHY